MLLQLAIENFVTVRKLHLDFSAGTTVMTGDTGAGKSILLDAISLALGERAKEIFFPETGSATITLHFDIASVAAAKNFLTENDFSPEECILRRIISKEGRSRCYLNGTPASLSQLRTLGLLLVKLHSQHEQQLLFQPEVQLAMVDLFAGHTDLQKAVREKSALLRQIRKKMIQYETDAEKQQTNAAWLTSQLNEFESLAIQPDEFIRLDEEHKRFSRADSLLAEISKAHGFLSENEDNVHKLLRACVHALDAAGNDESIISLSRRIKMLFPEIEDIANELHHLTENITHDPEKLNAIETRLGILFQLARKYKIQPERLYDYQKTLEADLHENQQRNSMLETLQAAHEKQKKAYEIAARRLSESRAQHALTLAHTVTAWLQKLAMPHAAFSIDFTEAAPGFSETGTEKALFRIRTSAGCAMKPLAQTLSGGELSRFSLALATALGKHHTIPVLIFDEIDAGMSGATAETVGRLLRKLGEHHQVLCVTHAPQVASLGQHHLLAKKIEHSQKTHTEIHTLSAAEKVGEIARMLGGQTLTQKTLAHAAEMVEHANN